MYLSSKRERGKKNSNFRRRRFLFLNRYLTREKRGRQGLEHKKHNFFYSHNKKFSNLVKFFKKIFKCGTRGKYILYRCIVCLFIVEA